MHKVHNFRLPFKTAGVVALLLTGQSAWGARDMGKDAPPPQKLATYKPFYSVSNAGATSLLRIDRQALRQAAADGGKIVLADLSLEPGLTAFLEMKPVRVLSPNARIVVGRAEGGDVPMDYDASAVHVFHGKVQGYPESQVVLFSSPRGVRAHIDLSVSKRFLLAGVASDAQVAGGQMAEVSARKASNDALPAVPHCGHDVAGRTGLSGGVAGCCFEPSPDVVYHTRMAVTEIALESDYELYANFNDTAATIDYMIEVMARTNAIFMRDINTRFEIVFMRVFDNPASEPGFMSNPDPLNGYVDYWQQNMGAVARDTGAFLTGRRDLPYGGIAYIGAVCTDFAYCVCGYLNGFPDPTRPNSGDYDLGVVAHELGHNFNACHTPDYCPQIDTCYPPPTTPQRGTMMSYCSQTVSGGNMVTELWYHRRLRRVMRDFVEFSAFCLSYDCNENGVDDNEDLLVSGSDTNGNGILDVCEDCNENSILDPADISGGGSTDFNANGIPDECEPDCNSNNSPDDWDISLGSSVDVWGNGVPDECDRDCDGNKLADYNQIQADLSRDIDRNIELDACQDCDGDGINDIVELRGARNAWVASDVMNFVSEFHAISGVRVKSSTTGQLNSAQDLIIAPGNRVLVSSANNNKIVGYDAIMGVHQGDFVPSGSGGLNYPTGLIIGPNGNLFVSSRNSNSVIQYDGATGSLIGTFVPAGSGGLASPFGILFGPNGNLFVTSGGNQVLEFDGQTGSFVRVFVSNADNGGLAGARGMVFKPDGNLLVASFNTDAILEYDGTTGASLGKWNSGGTSSALYLDGPWGIRLGPNGNIFCTRDLPAFFEEGDHDHDHDHDHFDHDVAELTAPLHVTAARIMEFDIANGQYLQSFILGDDTGLRSPTGFDFMPGTDDCNFNLLPDNCDIAQCSGNPACADCDANAVPDSCDIASCSGLAWCDDCNANSVPDMCDISSGTSLDESPADGVPDECVIVEPPPAPTADPSGITKTRFISFSVPSSGGAETALRVKLVSLHHVVPPYTGGPSIPFSAFEGQARWVGAGHHYIECSPCNLVFAYKLQCTPLYRDWSAYGLLDVFGSAIVPSSTYQVENVAAICKGNEAECMAVSPPLTVSTTRWGDIETPYNPPSPTTQPDAGDISALVNSFRGAMGAPRKVRVLLIGTDQFGNLNVGPDVSFAHISACVDAFRGLGYPHQIETCP